MVRFCFESNFINSLQLLAGKHTSVSIRKRYMKPALSMDLLDHLSMVESFDSVVGGPRAWALDGGKTLLMDQDQRAPRRLSAKSGRINAIVH